MARLTEGTPAAEVPEITLLLERWRGGDRAAGEELLRRTYGQLRRLAAATFRRERDDHTLQATAVVHEAYLSLAGNETMTFRNRAHFIGFMAHVMRRVLVDHARKHNQKRRGGGYRKITLAEAQALRVPSPPELVPLDDALRALAEVDGRKAALVEMRFFGGMTLEEAAAALGISRSTAVREWQRARAWLFRALRAEVADES